MFAITAVGTFQRGPQYIPSHLFSLQLTLIHLQWNGRVPCCLLWTFVVLSVTSEARSWKSMHFCPTVLEFSSPGSEKARSDPHGQIIWKDYGRYSGQLLAEVLTSVPNRCRWCLWHQLPALESPQAKIYPSLQVFLAEAPDVLKQTSHTTMPYLDSKLWT